MRSGFETLQGTQLSTLRGERSILKSPYWALGRVGPSQVLNSGQERDTFCAFPVRPGNVWAVGAIFTLGVGLGRETGSVTESEALPGGRRDGGEAADK